ncbi:hypothetical protein SAMN02745126_06574 [Enhydrobacter aerosaccus]|uniref:Uncharacterized protein n=2 Tax=Enhydrobacter aerosaccus TaxID=225324 RepID=A0A1T4TNY5_9HYPH|nr:hypothetical protein SAMN02745126_06574 [Enhydrobacter aerosaccus]
MLSMKGMSLFDMLETRVGLENHHNAMARQLGGHMLELDQGLPTLLEAAKETLRGVAWFGF